jgi:hypothetical protein
MRHLESSSNDLKQIMLRSLVESTTAFLKMSRSAFSLATSRLSYSPSVGISTSDIPKH